MEETNKQNTHDTHVPPPTPKKQYAPDPNRYTADPAIPNPEAAWHKVAAYPLSTNLWALAGFALVIRLFAYVLLHRRTAKERVKVP